MFCSALGYGVNKADNCPGSHGAYSLMGEEISKKFNKVKQNPLVSQHRSGYLWAGKVTDRYIRIILIFMIIFSIIFKL